MIEPKLAAIMCIMFLATVFRTTFGFGEALVSVPLLALVIPVKVAAPIAVLASVLIAAVIVAKDWRHIHFQSARSLIFSTLFGLPLGLIILKTASEPLIKIALAILLLSFSSYSLLITKRAHLENDRFAWIFGFSAGILGGSYGLNGPPLAIYGSLRRWAPERFRATLQAYFFPASALGLIGFVISGLWTHEVTHLFLYSLPAIAMGIGAGRAVSRRIAPHRFDTLIYFGLIFVALVLITQRIWQ